MGAPLLQYIKLFLPYYDPKLGKITEIFGAIYCFCCVFSSFDVISMARNSVVDPDPDHALFARVLQDANKNNFFQSFFSHLHIFVHLHHYSMIKSHKEVTKQYK
jgi:hypothetical protein